MANVVWYFLISVIPAVTVGKRVSVAAEAELSYHEHVDDLLESALIGVWQTDYHGVFVDTHVIIRPLGFAKLRYLHGADAQLHHFEAESAKFDGDQGVNAKRLLTVTQLFPMTEMASHLAEVTQRIDGEHPVRHKGLLSLEQRSEGPTWVIEWEHQNLLWGTRRRWWRTASAVKGARKSEPTVQDTDGQVTGLALSLVRSWDEDCMESDETAKPLRPGVSLTVSVGGGFRFGGVGASLSCDVGFDPEQVDIMRIRLQCVVGRMRAYSMSRSDPQNATRIDQIAQNMSAFLNDVTSVTRPECMPSMGFSLAFSVVPYPPFLWPVPALSMSFSWAKPLETIKACMPGQNTSAMLDDAMNARPEGQEAGDLAEAVAYAENPSAVSFSVDRSKGPSFSLLPFVGFGWSWSAEVSVAVNMRKLLRKARRSSSWMQRAHDETQCDRDREDFFRDLASWGMAAHTLLDDPSTPCEAVKETLEAIFKAHPQASLQGNPLGLVPHVQQLDDQDYFQEDSQSISLGGGSVYVGTDGVSVGVFETVAGRGDAGGYHHPCKAFARFVNLYHARVAPGLADIAKDADCSVDFASIPPLKPGGCATVAPDLAGLPMYPEITLNQTGHIEAETDSQCSRCMRIRSYGAPCRFCPRKLLSSSCEEFFDAFRLPCLGPVEVPLKLLDQRTGREADPRWRCAAMGGQVFIRNALGEKAEMDVRMSDEVGAMGT